MTAQEIADELEDYYGQISSQIDKDNPTGLIDDLGKRCQLLARSAVLLADAQFIHNKARGAECNAPGVPEMTATLMREYLTGACASEARLVTLAERLNSTLVHQIDSIRTMISYTKMVMNQ